MKVTAIIPDEIIDDVQKYSGGQNITESITMALKEWLYIKRIKSLNEEVARNPLCFRDGFSTDEVRNFKTSHDSN